MARRNTTGSSSGRRGSSRNSSGGKSFSGRGKSPGKSFRKSDSGDTGKPFSAGKGGERGAFGKKRPSSQGPRGERPFKKFDKPYGKKEEGSSDSRGSSYGNKRGFSKDSKPPYKKFDSDDKGKSFGKERGDSSQSARGERPFKKFDKPYGKKEEGPSDSRGSSYGNKRGFSKDSKRPYKKFDSDDKGKSFDKGRADSSQSARGERPFKKFDKPFRKKDEGSSYSGKGTYGDRISSSKNRFGKPEGKSYPKTPREDSGKGKETPREEKGFFKKSKSRYSEKPRAKDLGEETTAPAQTEKIRLNKYIANSGVCSRREADELITMGLISVNGKTISELGYKVNPGDEVRYENKVLKAEKPVYILLNKPKGYLTTTEDPQERNTVMHIIGNAVKERIYPVGRLDRNTTGLLLLTNDGELAEKLMHPSYNIKKIYKVELDRPLTKADFQKIQEGIVLEEGRAMVDDLAIISEDGKTVGLEIHIGWNRIVRRIFESLEYDVVRLDRSVYAGLDKKDLGRGHWRFLTKEELIRLKHYK